MTKIYFLTKVFKGSFGLMGWLTWGKKLNKRQGEVTMRIVRECRDTLETELTLGYKVQFLSVGASPSLLN